MVRIQAGIQAGAEAGTVEESGVLPGSPWLAQPSSLDYPGPPVPW